MARPSAAAWRARFAPEDRPNTDADPPTSSMSFKILDLALHSVGLRILAISPAPAIVVDDGEALRQEHG